MIGVGEFFVEGERCLPAEALATAGLTPLVLGPKEGLALLNGTQFSTAYALAGLFEAETLFQAGAGHRRARRPTPRTAPTRRSIRASTPCAATAARSRPPTRCAA